MTTDIDCPYCQATNKVAVEQKWSDLQIVLCDPDSGGCDKYFVRRVNMAGDQKTAAQIRTEAFLKADPDHFKKLAAKRKGQPNPSSTKFTSKVATKFGAKGGKAKRKKRTPEEIKRDQLKLQAKIKRDNDKADREFQMDAHKKIVKEGFKGPKS